MSSFLRTVVLPCLAVGMAVGCAPARTSRERADPTTVTSADLENPNEPIESVLQRKVPGLVVTRSPDGGIALQIRGAHSFIGADTRPLYLLNGNPFTPGPRGELTGIDPHEIESIRVLKGAEAAIHGSMGANGVIVITTKKREDASLPDPA